MLTIFQITNTAELPRIRTWVSVADHRCQLIHAQQADHDSYHVVVESRTYETDHAAQFAAEFAIAVTETQFPLFHPAP